MLDCELYPAIYKRKSFHLFRNIGNETITPEEQMEIKNAFKHFSALCPDIKTAIRIVPAEETTCTRGEEYCILLYSEKKEHYLQNIGYIGEQLDLYLTQKNIGTLWFGIGKTEEAQYDGFYFVIMIAIAKIDDERNFRKNMFKSKRKPVDEIWQGEQLKGITDIVRFAPSACNTQPWIVEHTDNILKIFRYKKPGKRGIMPADKVSFYDQIDMGIFLCFLELCMMHEKIPYKRELKYDAGLDEEKTLYAVYQLQVYAKVIEQID